ncbi:MAG TPA: hypothetical protein VII92_12560 [Anaerolineae bacterium]
MKSDTENPEITFKLEEQLIMTQHHKWIAAVVWIGLLAANLITSLVAVSAVTAGDCYPSSFKLSVKVLH